MYVDGEILRYADARIGLLTHALHYGTACFEGIRAYWNPDVRQLFVLQGFSHFDRLHRSARVLEMSVPRDTHELVAITVDLLRRNEIHGDAYIRPILFKSSEVINPAMDGLAESFAIYVTAFGRHADSEMGMRCMVSARRKIPDASIPTRAKITGTYVNAALARSEARRHGFDDAIQLTTDGRVSEASVANVFMVRDRVLSTPPVTDGILEGITRRLLMEMIREELQLPVVERSIDPRELYGCDELFLCGTGVEVLPVTDVGGRQVGDGRMGRVTRELRQRYFRAVRGYVPGHQDWLTAVYTPT